MTRHNPRGEWWIDDMGNSNFADGDVGDMNHESIAFYNALGIDFDDLEVQRLQIFPNQALSKEAVRWLKAHGSPKEAIAFFKAGGVDAREYAMEHQGYIRVQEGNFQVQVFDDDALQRMQNYDGWEEDPDPDEQITVEEYSTHKTWTVRAKRFLAAESAEQVKRMGESEILKYRDNPAPKGRSHPSSEGWYELEDFHCRLWDSDVDIWDAVNDRRAFYAALVDLGYWEVAGDADEGAPFHGPVAYLRDFDVEGTPTGDFTTHRPQDFRAWVKVAPEAIKARENPRRHDQAQIDAVRAAPPGRWFATHDFGNWGDMAPGGEPNICLTWNLAGAHGWATWELAVRERPGQEWVTVLWGRGDPPSVKHAIQARRLFLTSK